eukprot:TRINITY_DN6654_c0_g2_i3.p1 TRINITY_DN6654_c0_g2~~TRINITY_DN6654_c0_g2_i3.p1  ORF type:complete len:230 (+),score=53.51 TRINITY_DN6654_c0_g2_i3:156-845(+)
MTDAVVITTKQGKNFDVRMAFSSKRCRGACHFSVQAKGIFKSVNYTKKAEAIDVKGSVVKAPPTIEISEFRVEPPKTEEKVKANEFIESTFDNALTETKPRREEAEQQQTPQKMSTEEQVYIRTKQKQACPETCEKKLVFDSLPAENKSVRKSPRRRLSLYENTPMYVPTKRMKPNHPHYMSRVKLLDKQRQDHVVFRVFRDHELGNNYFIQTTLKDTVTCSYDVLIIL